MRTIYLMDTTLPPCDYDKLPTFSDIIENKDIPIDTSYTYDFQYWIKNEFQKICESKNANCDFDFSDILFTYYKETSLNLREGFFDSIRNLLAVKAYNYTTGRESSLQKVAIHESTHAVTSQFSIVGLAIAEGIACYMEELYCEVNNIPVEDGSKQDEGYIFSKLLVKNIISNVYDNDFAEFLRKIKKGNESEFLSDLDIFLNNKNLLYNSKELLKLSSFLFYAKDVPVTPFREYSINEEMEYLRNEVLKCFSKDNKLNESSIIYDYYDSISKVTKLFNSLKLGVDDPNSFTTYVDQKIGSIMVKYGGNKLLDTDFLLSIFENFSCSGNIKSNNIK